MAKNVDSLQELRAIHNWQRKNKSVNPTTTRKYILSTIWVSLQENSGLYMRTQLPQNLISAFENWAKNLAMPAQISDL